MNEYLYHYTSMETLALILKNKTIRFNNLLNVDDPEEAETKDLEKAGKHCLVSCWTDNSEDVIPMWNMYTPDMKGVRIRMRKNPFKKYTYKKDELYFSEKTLSYIDYRNDSVKNVSIIADCPLLFKVEYTEDEDLLHPTMVGKNKEGIHLYFDKIGRYKREYWNFQEEYRYMILTAPWSMEELENIKSVEEYVRIFNRLLDKNNTQFCNEIFLSLADDVFDDMEILLAPKTSESEYIIVQALLDKFCTGKNVILEKSRIRVK